MLDIHESFAMGWEYGHRTKRALTGREIEAMFPQASEIAFAQGMLDGILGDRWRLDQPVRAN